MATNKLALVSALMASVFAAACGGGGGGGTATDAPVAATPSPSPTPTPNPSPSPSPSPAPPPPATKFSLGGTVSGLSGTVSLTNGLDTTSLSAVAETVNLTANGPYSFPTSLATGTAYAIGVVSQPAGQTCVIRNGTGNLAAQNIGSIDISCKAPLIPVDPTLSYFQRDTANSYSNPGAIMMASDGNIYGNSYYGIFKITGGGVVSLLYSTFQVNQTGALIEGADGALYGVERASGAFACGRIFRLTTAAVYSVLHEFKCNDGQWPMGRLLLASDGWLYGTTGFGGDNNGGTIFKIQPSGAGFATLYSLGIKDGTDPEGGLMEASDGNLYGAASAGSTIYKITKAGTFSVLHKFDYATEGSTIYSELMQSADGYLYGTTTYGGTLPNVAQNSAGGTAFRVSLDGKFKVLHTFGTRNTTVVDGQNPYGSLMQLSDGNFYGVTRNGGNTGTGTIYRMTPEGAVTIVKSLDNLAGLTSGFQPVKGLIVGSDGHIYGTTSQGYTGNAGSVFKLY